MEQEKLTKKVLQEKDWHNQSAGKDIRRVQEEKYYRGIVDRMWNDYIECINKKLSRENTKLFDYGCGKGNNLIENFSSKIKMGIGVDISENLIKEARIKAEKEGVKNLDFFVMDAMNTTFDNETFDIVVGSSILHHLDLKISLNEIKRVLKSDGKAVFFEPLGINPFIALYRKLTPKARTVDEHPFTRRDIKQIKEIFPNAEIRYYSFFTLFAVPFRKFKLFSKMCFVLNFMDKIILGKYSPFKYMAWICLIEMRKN